METASATQVASKESGKSSPTTPSPRRDDAPGVIPAAARRRARPLGEHPNSILANLDKLTPAQQRKYHANKAKFEGDQEAMDRWALSGFQSGAEEDEAEQHYPELD